VHKKIINQKYVFVQQFINQFVVLMEKNYGNACQATCQGITVSSKGVCEDDEDDDDNE